MILINIGLNEINLQNVCKQTINKLTLFHVGGGETPPPHQFLLNDFLCKNRIDLKLLDILSYTYTHPIHLKF